MHPIVVDHVAADLRSRRLAEAAVHRHVQAVRPSRPAPHTWRSRQARRLLALARRLDPTLEPAASAPRVALR